MRKGLPFVISAPSGAGKSTLAAMLLAEFPRLRFSISCTTRNKREGEVEGRDYYFLDEGEFQRQIKSGNFVEWAKVHDNYYGTPVAPVREMLDKGADVLFDIDVQGAGRLRLVFPYGFFVFILPPSLAVLEERLRLRGKDNPEVIRARMRHARGEIAQAVWYDALIVNDDLAKAYQELRSCYLAASLAPGVKSNAITVLLEEEPDGKSDSCA